MSRRRFARSFLALAVLAVAAGASSSAHAQTVVFLCEGEGRSLAVAGASGPPPGCRALADPARELLLSPPQSEITTLARELVSLSRRVSQLETLLLGQSRLRPAPPAPAVRPDPFDTRGRMRDLGQDLDRRLDDLGR